MRILIDGVVLGWMLLLSRSAISDSAYGIARD